MNRKKPPDPARVHIRLRGRVQGVGFRAFVADQFRRLGVTGWVRNVGYDRLEAVGEGDRPTLEVFVGTVLAGPRGSRVDESQVDWGSWTGEFEGAEIRY